MLSNETKTKIRTTLNQLAKNIPNFNKRFAQNKMIAEIANTFADSYTQNILCVEAPTGTGKTFAYLISGIILAKKFNYKLIISSSNVALQEQLTLKDIPDVIKYTNLDFKFALVKGRSRYICVRNLINIVESSVENTPLFDNTSTFNAKPEKDEIDKLRDFLTNYELKKWNGEIDSLDAKVHYELWNKVACNRFTCTASKCEFYDECAFFKARKKIHNADVIIANHDLVLADINSGNTVLPNLEESFIIFDEAHHLPNKALSHFAFNTNLDSIKNTSNQAIAIMQKIINTSKNGEIGDYSAITTYATDIANYLTNIEYDEDIYIFSNGVINDELLPLIKNLKIDFNILAKNYNNLKEAWQNFNNIKSMATSIKQQMDSAIGECEMHLLNIIATLDNFTLTDNKDSAPQSRWVERLRSGKNKYNYKLNSSKIDVASDLQKILWSRIAGSVLTSATLSALGNFTRFNSQLNLSEENSTYLRLPSPFNNSKVDFIIAKMQCNPTDNSTHTYEIAEQLLTRIDENSGTLVLFASNYQMQAVADIVEDKLTCKLLIQGSSSKQKILETHIELRKKKQGCIIFGLDSFAEGVDLKGDYLTHLIIAKLRFSVPNSPIEKTISEYLASQGRRSFFEISLPDAGLRLVQACGRLIRTETDTGKITIFDNRLITKGYGKQLLNSLPDYNIIIE